MEMEKQERYDKKAIGKRIQNLRKSLGISRREMAAKIGKAEKYYADIERGYCGMSLDTLIDISDCLHITLDYIILGEEDTGVSSSELENILFYIKGCDETRRKKALQLLRIYLSE